MRELDSFKAEEPSTDLAAAVDAFMKDDPDATFGFFAGGVDSFATRPKNEIPDYALPVLQKLGLSTSALVPELFPDPTQETKYTQNLDQDFTVQFPYQLETDTTTPTTPDPEDGDSNTGDPGSDIKPVVEARTQPAVDPEPRDDSWQQPSERLIALEAPAVQPILSAFLGKYPEVFQINDALLRNQLPNLAPRNFQVGRFFRKASFQQTYDADQPNPLPILGGDLSVLFDVNWNIIGLSRMVITPEKLKVDITNNISRTQALDIALAAVEEFTGKDQERWQLVEIVLGVDPMRRHLAWHVNLIIPDEPENDVTVLIDARFGRVLNISDNVEAFWIDAPGEPDGIARLAWLEEYGLDDVIPDVPAYTDAKVRRWAYTSGSVEEPFQVVTNNMYTRDDNTLVHDFFYTANDQRTNGSLTSCSQTSSPTTWTSAAYGVNNSSTYIRHTHRSDRNFSLWSPAAESGTFAESHNYFWSRAFFQWLKPALKELGVLPSSASNYPRVLMVVNACIDDIGYANGSGLKITVQHNEGESSRKIRVQDLCRLGNGSCSSSDVAKRGNHYASCDGLGCYATPSITHHEINHYVLAQFFGVGSSLDCGAGDQLRFLHEGTMGSVIPQAFWHHYYGIGYSPSDLKRLFTADEVRGRVHVDNGSLLTLGNWLCVNNTTVTASNKGPYNVGRVPAQALWKFYHGITVNGSTFGSTWRPATDTDFNILTYWAADLVAGSTYKDRYEVANRVMEILDKYSNWSSSAKSQYCAIWQQHGLRTYIKDAYCS